MDISTQDNSSTVTTDTVDTQPEVNQVEVLVDGSVSTFFTKALHQLYPNRESKINDVSDKALESLAALLKEEPGVTKVYVSTATPNDSTNELIQSSDRLRIALDNGATAVTYVEADNGITESVATFENYAANVSKVYFTKQRVLDRVGDYFDAT